MIAIITDTDELVYKHIFKNPDYSWEEKLQKCVDYAMIVVVNRINVNSLFYKYETTGCIPVEIK